MEEELLQKEKYNLETTIDSLLKEWEMYADQISPKNLEYIKTLSEYICKFKHRLNKLSKPNKSHTNDIIPNSSVDERMEESIDEYKSYLDYKNDYDTTNNIEFLNMAQDEFSHFLKNIKIALEEIDKATRDNSEESANNRLELKSFGKWVYQMFN